MRHEANKPVRAVAYTTSEIGFIRCERKSLVAEFSVWQADIFEPLGWRIEALEGEGIESGLQALSQKVVAPVTRHLFLQCGNGWTAYLDNGPHGTDFAAVAPQLVLRSGGHGIRMVCATGVPERLWPNFLQTKSRYAALIFESYPGGTDEAERAIFSANDGGRWKHTAFGRVLEEEGGIIQAIDAANPFTQQAMECLLRKFGILAFEPSWYNESWTLVSKNR